jgi:hypothetical protein
MTPERRLEIEQAANLYGSANCWAGTSGKLATMIRELLEELDRRERTVQNAIVAMSILSDVERMEVMLNFCQYCGCVQSSDRGCQCWNDE